MNKKEHTKIPESGNTVIGMLRELLEYKYLIFLLVKRTFVSQYKQTVLGPLWAIIQPLLTSVVFNFVFGDLAGLTPSGIPSFLFYFSGSMLWNFFSTAFTNDANVFVANSALLSKVYFPRLVLPVANVITQMIPFVIQYVFFIFIYVIYIFVGEPIKASPLVLVTPLLVFELGLLAFGLGIFVSSLTTKYRDLSMLVGFGTQLLMYISPIAYDISIIPSKFLSLYLLNPVTPVITTFRYAYFGIGNFSLFYFAISWISTILIVWLSLYSFMKIEKTFTDTL